MKIKYSKYTQIKKKKESANTTHYTYNPIKNDPNSVFIFTRIGIGRKID